VAVLSETASVRRVAAEAGASTPNLLPPCTGAAAARACAAQLSTLLGLAPAAAEAPVSTVDLAVLHLRPPGCAPWPASAAGTLAATLDALLLQLCACPDVRQQLYVLLLLGRNGGGAGSDAGGARAQLPAHLVHLRPQQSCAARRAGCESAAVECVPARALWHAPMHQVSDRTRVSVLCVHSEHALLCIHSLDAVVRRDGATQASAAEFRARGARGTVAAEDVLEELAYKLGRAPKFGA
jgi:hypothetical protein